MIAPVSISVAAVGGGMNASRKKAVNIFICIACESMLYIGGMLQNTFHFMEPKKNPKNKSSDHFQ